MCAALGSLPRLVLHHRRPPGCLPLREEARLRVSATAGLEQLARYLANHAAFDEYCRAAESGGDGARRTRPGRPRRPRDR
ncbi:MAG TPA: hypothetical protein VFW18_01705 [Gaiellales bacterium]|nr:hypothetical protein [Gaiellales bacterium]